MYSAEIDALKVRNIYITSYITKNVLHHVYIFSESILSENTFNRIILVFLHIILSVVFENQWFFRFLDVFPEVCQTPISKAFLKLKVLPKIIVNLNVFTVASLLNSLSHNLRSFYSWTEYEQGSWLLASPWEMFTHLLHH